MSFKPEFMQKAIQSAKQGIEADHGGPFGACIVKDGQVLAVTHNTVLIDNDPTCHAEVNAIRMAAKNLNNHVLKGCEIYTTAEPCPMCLAALYWARVDKIYVGLDKTVAGKYGFDDHHIYQEFAKDITNREIAVEIGFLGEECEAVFARWKSLARQIY